MSPKDSGSSLVRRRSSRKSIHAPQSQDRKLSEKEALVRRARVGAGVGQERIIQNPFVLSPRVFYKPKPQHFRLGLEFMNDSL